MEAVVAGIREQETGRRPHRPVNGTGRVLTGRDSPELTGTLKVTFDRGYGFIQPDDKSDDVFVHKTEVPEGCWELGKRFRFRTKPPVKGKSRCAVEVRAA